MQNAWFYDGIFKVAPDPGREPITELDAGRAQAAAARRARAPPRRPRRRRRASCGATARASSAPRASSARRPCAARKWVVIDRCDGTLTRVARGLRHRPRLRGAQEDVIVRAGKQYLARKPSELGLRPRRASSSPTWWGTTCSRPTGRRATSAAGSAATRVARRALVTHVTTYTLAFVPAFIWIGAELEPVWAIVAAVLIFVPHLMIDDGRVRRALPRARQAASTGSTSGWRRRSTSPSTCSRCSSSRCWWERHEPRAAGLLALLAVALLAVGVGAASFAGDRRAAAALELTHGRRPLHAARRAGAADGRRDRRHRRQDARRRPRTTLPARPHAPREGDRAADQGRRGRDRLRLPVHRAESDDVDADNALIEAVARRRRSCSGPTDVDAGRRDRDLRRRRGLRVQRRDARRHALRRRRTATARIRRMPFELQTGSRRFALAAATSSSAARRERRAGRRRVDRLPGPARDRPAR